MAAIESDGTYRLEDGRRLCVAEYGDPSGVPVFGFHGTPGSHLLFTVFDAAAREEGVRLLAPDRPGYGSSDFMPGRTLLDWPGDVAEVADALGLERFGVLGTSGGGPHAAACAHVSGARLFGAAIVGSIAPLEGPESLADMLPGERMMFRLARRSPTLVRLIMRASLEVTRRAGPAGLERLARALPAPDRQALERPEFRNLMYADATRTSRTWARAAAQDFALFTRYWGFPLGEIAVAIDVFHGERDRNAPMNHARLLADRIPQSTLHLFAEHGHLSILAEAPSIVRAAAGLA